jgi:pimeloyl-ACP methyl ester carboxylesterase
VDVPETRYARSGDVNIAYQVFGQGPLDLVYVPGFVSHVEDWWEEPAQAAFLRRLASFSRVLMFDKRGTGLSDRVPIDRLPTLEERMDDVRAVMDAAGSRRAAVFGVSEGGSMSVLFAATYPDRTTALVTFGIFAKRIWSEDYPGRLDRKSVSARSSRRSGTGVTWMSRGWLRVPRWSSWNDSPSWCGVLQAPEPLPRSSG